MKNIEIDISNVELRTKRLLLRPFQQEDLDDFYRYAKVDGVGQPAGWIPHESKAETQVFLDQFITGKKAFAIEMNKRVIGSITIEQPHLLKSEFLNDKNARTLGYSLAKDKWGQGIMPEVVEAVLAYLFDEVKLDLVIGSFIPSNERSRRVLEKCGFTPLSSTMVTDQYGDLIELTDLAIDLKTWQHRLRCEV